MSELRIGPDDVIIKRSELDKQIKSAYENGFREGRSKLEYERRVCDEKIKNEAEKNAVPVRIESDGFQTKVWISGRDVSKCLYGVDFSHSVLGNTTISLEIDVKALSCGERS